MLKKIVKNGLSQKNIDLGFVLVSFLLAVYLNWSFERAIILALLVYVILNDFKPDFYKKVAIIFAVIAAMTLAVRNPSISEKLSIVSFISLIIYLFFQILITWRTNRPDQKRNH